MLANSYFDAFNQLPISGQSRLTLPARAIATPAFPSHEDLPVGCGALIEDGKLPTGYASGGVEDHKSLLVLRPHNDAPFFP